MIALIDYGSGNLRSVEKAFRKLGADIQLVSQPDSISQAEAIVLPGVGAFANNPSSNPYPKANLSWESV